MGRPRRDDGEADARTRIVEAFWEVLETHQLNDISVGMLTAKAGCNRGTFYYHFADRNALIQAVIQGEVADVPRRLFRFISGVGDSPLDILGEKKLDRLRLLLEHGGYETVAENTKRTVLSMWQAVLCPHGEELKPDTRAILEYMVNGALGMLRLFGSKDSSVTLDEQLTDWLRDNSATAIKHIYCIEGITHDELVQRLQMANTVMSLTPGTMYARKDARLA